MRTTYREHPTVLVTDAGRGSAITIIRSLGRQGLHVIAADSDPSSLGFRSRYVRDRLVYPPPETSPRRTVAALLEAVQGKKVDLLIPVTDAIILPLSEERHKFERLCQLALPETAALQVVTNKMKTLELAQRLGVPTPRTCLVQTIQEAVEAGSSLGWPVVLKPQVSRLYRDHAVVEAYTVSYAEDPDQLVEQMQRLEGRCPVLLQEYNSGAGLGVELLLDRGEPLAAFQHKRLREIPINGGASAFRESVRLDPALYEYSVRMLAALKYTGLAMVEFKVGRDGPKLMEINGRVWGSLPLAMWSGMDFPARLARLYLEDHPQEKAGPYCVYRVGMHARNLELEMLWIATVLRGKRRYPFLAMPQRRRALVAIVELFHPAYKNDILSMDDPAPGLSELPRIARKLVRKVREAA